MPAERTAPARPNVFTLPAGEPFLAGLARALLNGHLPRPGGVPPSPIDLAAITLLLPTRRAVRALQEAFLDEIGRRNAAGAGVAMLLPRIHPIAEGEDELTLIAGLAASGGADGRAPADIPPAVSEMERRLALTTLVLKWSQAMRSADGGEEVVAAGADTPAQAVQLAAELARLMDMVETEQVSLSGLAALVPDTFSQHWQKTLQFLTIITDYWPLYLAERGMTSPADRRNRLILAEARRLVETPPRAPVIVAGVTGSIPATGELMRAVMALDNGAIVLPGLDDTLDDEAWAAVGRDHPEHPQFGLHRLLGTLGLERSQVAVLPGAPLSPRTAALNRLVGETMRPASTTEHWHRFADIADRPALRAALSGVALIEAPSAQDEAEAIALILRDVVETPGRTAALVSPDRLLARRVGVRLESWGIRVDDSAGRPFAKTVPGAFLELVIDTVAEDFAPAALVALLKHPLTRLGLDTFAVRKAARALEIAAFRTAYLGRGLAGVEAALERAAAAEAQGERREAAVRRLWDEDWAGARDLVARLKAALAPLAAAFDSAGTQPLAGLARAHVAAAEALAALPPPAPTASAAAPPQGSPLWTGEAGIAAQTFFAGLTDPSMPALDIAAVDYADLYRGLIAGENVRPRVPVHPRLAIWGPFEARLQQPDVIVLGSLNDGTWPETADPGPWLNRPMRQALGLPSPEAKLGQAAHDFTMLLGAGTVYLTRAEKIDGVPTVPSRWLMRLEALLGGLGLDGAMKPDRPWLGWARSRDATGARIVIEPPTPRPPVDARPRRMSVSGVETWIANPYAVYAARILGLEPLPRLGEPPDASLRGAIVHEALSRFTTRFPDTLPADVAGEVLAAAKGVLEAYTGHPRVAAFWLTRLERFARWFADTETARRAGIRSVVAEVKGRHVIAAPYAPFELTARADRIDVGASGLVITDYKTGTVPVQSKVQSGAAPQLPLEASIAAAGGFPGIPSAPVLALRYIRASGGEPPGEEVNFAKLDIAALAGAQIERLAALVARYDDPGTPYAALRRARFNYDYDPFAHLARVGEWSADSGGGEEG